jgi:hypothetical protein
VVSSTSHDSSLWSQVPKFFVGVALPCLIGLLTLIATYLSTRFRLDKPERVSVSVESCYQNTGIATSVAASMFTGDQLATAIVVPLFYGIVEMVTLACFCLVCWKVGWTKAPTNESFCTIIPTSYEVEQARLELPNAIEVVHNNNPKDDQDIEDLVFNQNIIFIGLEFRALRYRVALLRCFLVDLIMIETTLTCGGSHTVSS